MRKKNESFKCTWCNCWFREGCSHWIWIGLHILSWKKFSIFWHLLSSHTSTLFCVTCYQWRSVEQLFWTLWTKRHSLSATSTSTSTSTSTLFHKTIGYNRLACKIAIADLGGTVKRKIKWTRKGMEGNYFKL